MPHLLSPPSSPTPVQDYELLGLPTTPLPTSVEVRKAFRMQATIAMIDVQCSTRLI